MPLIDAVFALSEEAIHQYLALDPHTLGQLQSLHGKVIAFEIAGFERRLFFVPAPNRLMLFAHHESKPDCVIRGSLLALVKLGQAEEKGGQLFGGDVQITGDAALAHRFGQILAKVDIDWEEHLSRLIGDIPAHQFTRSGRELHHWTTQAHQALEQDLGEYLQEEALLSPHPEEVRLFNADVDRIRDDVERLETRVHRLLQALNGVAP